MIYCIWYPSGGFGHFINAVLTLHGNNFVRPNNLLKFSKTGDSHNLNLVVPKYHNDSWSGNIEFLDDKNYCVLIDNGINNQSKKFKLNFPTAEVIHICYSDLSWPIVGRTMIDKAMSSNINDQLPISEWDTDQPWAYREKYFLYLRDNKLRYDWKQSDEPALYVDDMLNYKKLFNVLNTFTVVDPFEELWKDWRVANDKYIAPVELAQDIIAFVKQGQSHDITHITDIWTQAVVYYYIWITYGVEVPHNFFADFFTNTDQIIGLIS